MDSFTPTTFLGSTSDSDCRPCPSGKFTSQPQQSSCSGACPVGWRVRESQGAVSKEAACEACSPGTYLGQPMGTDCALCPPGYYCPFSNMSAGIPCPAGKFSPSPGSADPSDCLACSAGSWAGAASAVCTKCERGKASAAPGAASSTACVPCRPGLFAAGEGSNQCNPCELGAYSEVEGATACSLCPQATYQPFEGKASRMDCRPCPEGATTLASGASSASSCIVLAYKCDLGKEPNTLNPTKPSDCSPLLCPEFMSSANITNIPSGCRGCPQGFFGVHRVGGGQCLPCPNQTLCPGFLPAPLPLVASSLGLPYGTRLPPPTSLLASNPATAVTLFAAGLNPPPTGFSFFTGNAFIAGMLGFCLCMMVVSLLVADVCRGGTFTGSLLRRVDVFSLDHVVRKEGQGPVKRNTALGGSCTLMMVLMFITFASLLFLRRYTDNVLTTNSIVVLSGFTSNMAKLPWAKPALLAQRPGVRVSVFSLAGLGSSRGSCDAPLSWSSKGLSGGAWALRGSVEPPSQENARTMLTFECVECTFTASSALTFVMPFTCQSLYLEATAVDPTGQVRALALDPSLSSATQSELLTRVTWELEVMLSVLLDLQDSAEGGGRSARGYQVLSSSGASETAFPGSSIIPFTSAVEVSVKLALQPTFTLTQLTQKLSLADLGASIIGLAGLISFFRFLFQNSEWLGEEATACGSRRGHPPQALSHSPEAPAREAPEEAPVQSNPLHDSADGEVWTRHSDGVDTWYSCNGVTAWELPPGVAKKKSKRKGAPVSSAGGEK
jgi:hypothetical protein